MKKYWLFCLLALPMVAMAAPGNNTTAPQPATMMAKKQPLLFIENKGQVADDKGKVQHNILFTAHQGAAGIYLNKTGISYQFTNNIYAEGKEPAGMPEKGKEMPRPLATQTHRFDMQLVGANANPVVKREQENAYFENYYLAHCPNGITGARSYEKLVYKNVYPQIDWVLYSQPEKGLKYDFVVHPGGNPADIKIAYKDANGVHIETDGSLKITTQLGSLTEAAPYTNQEGKAVSNKFILKENELSFAVGNYNPQQDLVIDPAVAWATYYGGNWNDYGYSCAVDGSDNVYMEGYTGSTSGIASSGGFQTTLGGSDDAFLVKFDATGNRLWATYHGGSGDDYGNSCAIDGSGNVYVIGRTGSTSGIASSGSFQTTNGGSGDVFLVKFDAAGSRLWATYYGGSGLDEGYSCAVDRGGNVYVTGYTSSNSGIASSGGFQTTYSGNYDVFLVKFDATGSRLWATYYGDSGDDRGFSCAVDGSNNVYMIGRTGSTSGISSSGGFQTTYSGSFDAFLVKFNVTGSRLWATYYGGNDNDYGYSCAIDGSGNVYMAGFTTSTSGIASSGGFQTTNGGGPEDAFLVKFDTTGSRLWATYYGGSGSDGGASCVADGSGNLYMAGSTNSASGIASNGGFQTTYSGNYDAFLMKFDANGNRLWATYYGSSGYNYGLSCAVDGGGNVYMAGSTNSTSGIASSGGFQTINGGYYDAFLAKILDCTSITTPTISKAGNVLTSSAATGNQWYLNGAPITGATNQNYTATQNGSYTVIVTVNGCSSSASLPSVLTNVGVNSLHNIISALYPNPVTQQQLYIDMKEKSSYQLIDLAGKILQTDQLQNGANTIQLPNVAAGLYFLKVGSYTAKIIVQ